MTATVRPLRYPAHCATCGCELAKGARAAWDRERRAATCERCLSGEAPAPAIDRGEAGGSARREWQRRHDRREQRVRAQWGPLAGIALAITDDPHSTRAWAYGARGERLLGDRLDAHRDQGIAVLHDRRIPGTRANIDHVVVSAAGVFVVDAKNYSGRVELQDRGGWFSTDYRLCVGGRDKTTLVRGMARQVAAVQTALEPAFADVPVTPVICFVDSEWGLFARPLRFGDVHILWPAALDALLAAEGALLTETIAQIEQQLALALCPA